MKRSKFSPFKELQGFDLKINQGILFKGVPGWPPSRREYFFLCIFNTDKGRIN